MDSLIDKVFIFTLCGIALFCFSPKIFILYPLLISVIISCVYTLFIKEIKIKILVYVIAIISIILIPGTIYFLPIFLYEYIKEDNRIYISILCVITICVAYGERIESIFVIIIMSTQALWMEYQNTKKNKYIDEYITTRDQGVELTEALKKKNKALIEKQEYEVYAATLNERNRIAREIHDSVGHVLSRCILQVGALMAIHKNEPVNDELLQVKNTLDIAMNSIRSSVHDLHDASIDLQNGIKNAIKALEKYEVILNYDVSDNIDNKVRHCILSIVKEAISNINRHSNGNHVWIDINEQPAFYQCKIKDNGTKKAQITTPGIGLENMTTRVESLHGNINISNDEGFTIFVTIPKKNLNK